ncbi:phosphatidate phosphatase LPIN3-like isoform X2 [Dendropsophus ebraccatus]|uniref:phosphatidate phosphatase LPIN3-like isoform X2 n=1 Tax=Dendropsophus ebraccatus TaxID=150705 RepID=UPI00383224F2
MNYVGQLAGSVLGRVRDLYKGVNPATLSGSIDVVVVRQPDGSFRSSPFHVRFGKLGILRSTEMTVDIEVNGEPVDLPMRLGDNGEAFFIQEEEEEEEPAFSVVSPHLPQATASLYVSDEFPEPSPAFHSPFTDTPTRRKNWSKRVMANRTDAANKSEDTMLPTCDSIYFSFSEIHDDTFLSKDLLSPDEEDLLQCSSSRSPSPKSDSELEVRTPGTPRSESCIEWDWGRLPQVSRPDLVPQMSQSLPPSPTRELEVLEFTPPDPELPDPRLPHSGLPDPQLPDPRLPHPGLPDPELPDPGLPDPELPDPQLPDPRLPHPGLPDPELPDPQLPDPRLPHPELPDPGLPDPELPDPGLLDSGLPDPELPDPRLPDPTEDFNADQSLPESGEASTPPCHTDAAVEPSPLHPDDVMSPDSQEVSLYFPNSDPHPPPPPLHKMEDKMEASIPAVEISLCGGLTDSWNIPEDRFLKYKISFSDFSQNPSLIDNPRLVLRIRHKFYNWATAAPILLCMQVYNQMLPQGAIDRISQQKMPPQSRGWWFSWRRRSLPNQPPVTNPKEYVEQNEDAGTQRLNKEIDNGQKPSLIPIQPKPCRRSLRLTSEQIENSSAHHHILQEVSVPATQSTAGRSRLPSDVGLPSDIGLPSDKSLNLRKGANEVVFSICTKFQGTCRTRAQIYLWESTDRIIVSDIDGTVTRSDALGHILPQLGKDWTQPGIVQLYRAIYMNDYKFVYCSARSVGLAEITKTFLEGVSEGGFTLPPGPLLLSPSSLFAALHREVIEKAPERFKIACLSDIQQLFTDPCPFYAAFGNRPNDVLAYREVGVPESRIFTVNPRGELTQELNSSFKSSYAALRDLVNVMFPPPSSLALSVSQEFSDFSFWRDPLADLSMEDIECVT